MSDRAEEVLRMEHITKQFGSVYANRNVSFDVRSGEVHTLLGENGAGKSTLMNVLFGLYQPTGGEIYIRGGQKVRIESPAQAVRLGIGMVHQHFMLVEAMTVFENIILGETRAKWIFIERNARKKEIMALSEKYGLEADPDQPVTELSVGAQQRVEILKALYRGCDLLVLDEPTAALTDLETEGLFEIMKKLTEEGKSVIFISHKMWEVLRVSDRITILRAGQTVETVNASEVTGEELAAKMIRRELKAPQYPKVEETGEDVIVLDHVSYHKESKHNGLNDVSLRIRRGEAVGIAGVDGNGQSQLAMLTTGNITPEEGTIELKGSKVVKFDPNGFIRENVSHIPEDRNKAGLIGNMSVADNLVLKTTTDSRFSDRILVMFEGKIMGEYPGKNPPVREISLAMAGK